MRALSVGLLASGLAGGVYLGQDRDEQQQTEVAQVAVQANLDEALLIKRRQAEHAAARAMRSQAESVAAQRAATEAKAAATKAKVLADKVAAEEKAAKAEKARKAAESTGTTAFTGPIPASCEEYTGNRKIGCAVLLDTGLKIDQFPCLDKLWKKESGWNHKARNPSSGAYGIPQSLPGSKMASVGSDWQTNPATQVKWGLGYIKGRYGTPCGAWNHSQAKGWY